MDDVSRTTGRITDVADLEAIYGAPVPASIIKETDRLHPLYAAFVKASTFVILATSGPGGLDASPRGDAAGFMTVENDKTLLLPDRRGNNRTDSLRNILDDPRVGLLFLIPGIGETLRINGRAEISVAPDLLGRFAVAGKAPRTVLVVHVEAVYFQCSRAVARAGLWDPAKHVPRSSLPSNGEILRALSGGGFDGSAYDRALDGRVKTTLY